MQALTSQSARAVPLNKENKKIALNFDCLMYFHTFFGLFQMDSDWKKYHADLTSVKILLQTQKETPPPPHKKKSIIPYKNYTMFVWDSVEVLLFLAMSHQNVKDKKGDVNGKKLMVWFCAWPQQSKQLGGTTQQLCPKTKRTEGIF